MTPKGLLRLKESSARLEQLAEGRFEPVIDDSVAHDRVRRLVLTSGKLYYDIVGHELRMQREGVGTVTVESDRIRFLAVDGSERATFVVDSAPQWVVQQPAGPAKASP